MNNVEKVIKKMIEWRDDSCFDNSVWWGYSTLSDETDIPVPELKTIMKTLLEKKVVELVPLTNGEGRIRGKGYFITGTGEGND